MKRKKWTPDERRKWEAAREETRRMLQERIELLKAELEAKKRGGLGRDPTPWPSVPEAVPHPALVTPGKKKWTPEELREWKAARNKTQRMLREHIERIKAELEEKKKSA
jgi:uncharacterized small protein (DUF1192 family)